MQSKNEFLILLGQTSTVWAQIESSLCVIFTRITKMDQTLARRIFYSANSFSGRVGMLKEAINCPTVQFNKDEGEFVKKCVNLSQIYSEIRNVIAHDCIVFLEFEGHEFSNQFVLVDGKYDRFLGGENALSSKQLTNFHANISHLFLIIQAFLQPEAIPSIQDYEQCLSLLQQLPKKPREIGLNQTEVDLLLSHSPKTFRL